VHMEANIDMNDLARKIGQTSFSEAEKSKYLDQAIIVLRERINQTGLAEAEVRKSGMDRIVVQIPFYDTKEKPSDVSEVEDTKAKAEKLLTQVGYLEFALVSDDQNKMGLAMKGRKIPGYRLIHNAEGMPFLVKNKPEFDGTQLKSSEVEIGQSIGGGPQITLKFNNKGKKLFAAVTRKNVNRRLAIILDNAVLMAPVIKTEISGGNAVITGSFSLDEAKRHSLILNAGALPARIQILESRVVSATLGKDSIKKGSIASIYGLIFVALFVILYYLKVGVIAVFALSLNIICILGAIASIKDAAMTLPGIAGLILTMGMAVDANVLIFERLREEIEKKGKRVKTAITAAYDKAFWTIFDANFTTFLTSFILYNIGKGPIKGFALILMVGIVSSMFTSIFVTKTVFQVLINFNLMEKVKMLSMLPDNINIKFIQGRKKAYILSLLVILISIAGFFGKGDSKFGIDFKGGSLIELTFNNEVQIEKLRASLNPLGEDVSIQNFGDVKDSTFLIRSKKGMNDSEKVIWIEKTAKRNNLNLPEDWIKLPVEDKILWIKEQVKDSKIQLPDDWVNQNNAIKEIIRDGGFPAFKVGREEEVGALVGGELKESSVVAILLSLVGIIIYIGFRFELKFAIAAICALAHDVIITVGVYCLLGYEMNVPTIAALLTIVGYSLNDTIVIFDRIRESLSSNSKKTRLELINDAVNATLSRTILTSLTTLLVVISILIYGGGIIHNFALTLFIGIIVGTYSSIFVASPLLVEFNKK